MSLENGSEGIMQGDIKDRFELVKERIREIPDELLGVTEEKYAYLDFFKVKAQYISFMLEIFDKISDDDPDSYKVYACKDVNYKMYEDIIGENYEYSYSNPDYAEEKLGAMGSLFSFVSAEIAELPGLVFDNKIAEITYLLETYLELYFMFKSGDEVTISSVSDVVRSYAVDYADYHNSERMMDTFIPGRGVASKLVETADLTDLTYLYRYGEYISETELRLAEYLNKLSQDRIDEIAKTFTDGFRRGYTVMGVEFEGKKYVQVRYHIGQERIVRSVCNFFGEMGLTPILFRTAASRMVKRGTVRQGYESSYPNQQFCYDHRNDNALFLTNDFVERRVNSTRKTYEELSQYYIGTDLYHFTEGFAGPAVIETFGEELFSPLQKASVPSLTEQQQELERKMYSELSQLSNEFIPGDSYSFSIIAFPIPDIGEKFEDIFDEIVAINTLDNEKYKAIQQSIIDVLDVSDKVRIVGMNGNKTDITVQMRYLNNPEKETQFENCTADVNIPLGEVFTSPVLKGTNGILYVSSTYLNGYNFKDIEIHIKDGVVSDYYCSNFLSDEDTETKGVEKGKRYIKENILFNHEFLPLGEFAIGTNTLAYTVARRYNILEKLPILIVEKTGPHFALGDTCYSHMEDHAVFNPDGKEIISRENDFSLLRDTEPDKAYFNCHTDITIPYNELGRLYTISENGDETDIIVEGRFVLPGTESLNEALDE
ncbi:Thermophilic metalloprotease (M29) [Lachnospiraceae bacterium NE2001]|nr:Thermophilic metalloprotease (M29) [Lachnospiraceae bacterium NE2001]